jgi:Trp operon repressor
MLRIVEEQLPTSSINRLLALGLTRQEIDALVIPLRTRIVEEFLVQIDEGMFV